MIEMVHTEFLKFKRRKIIFFVIGIILLFWAGMTFWVYNISEGDLGINGMADFYSRYGSYCSILLLFLTGLLFIEAFSVEYKNDTLKGLLQIPLTMDALFIAKILFIILVAIIIMAINSFLTVIGSVVCHFHDISFYNLIEMVKNYILIAVTIPISMCPVFFVTVLAKDNMVISTTIHFVYVLTGLIGINHLIGIHPISSLLNLLSIEQVAYKVTKGTKFLCVGNIIVVVIIIFILMLIKNSKKKINDFLQSFFS